jgi:hypothetical protein
MHYATAVEKIQVGSTGIFTNSFGIDFVCAGKCATMRIELPHNGLGFADDMPNIFLSVLVLAVVIIGAGTGSTLWGRACWHLRFRWQFEGKS